MTMWLFVSKDNYLSVRGECFYAMTWPNPKLTLTKTQSNHRYYLDRNSLFYDLFSKVPIPRYVIFYHLLQLKERRFDLFIQHMVCKWLGELMENRKNHNSHSMCSCSYSLQAMHGHPSTNKLTRPNWTLLPGRGPIASWEIFLSTYEKFIWIELNQFVVWIHLYPHRF